MRGTGWRAGSGSPDDPAGYGIRISAADRDRNFDRDWESVTLELDDGRAIEIGLSESFWRSCSELRSADVGRWLIAAGVAPWQAGDPPHIAVRAIEAGRFSARVMARPTMI